MREGEDRPPPEGVDREEHLRAPGTADLQSRAAGLRVHTHTHTHTHTHRHADKIVAQSSSPTMIPVLLWLVGVAVAQSTDVGLSNFYAVDFLADGQAERRFYLHGTAAKETVAVFTQPDGSRFVRQPHFPPHLL